MLTRKNKRLLLKFFSLFSVVRGYNILVIVIAQYLTAIFILAPEKLTREVVLDPNLLMLVLASAAAIAGGYIINNFYDSEKDLINRPRKVMLDRLVSQNTKLSFYFVLNFSSVIMASYVSFRAVVFFAIYIFGIWLYSHKLKRITFVGNLVAALLALTPFFAIFVYYRNLDTVIFIHASFLFLVVAMRELVKDLENLKGDLVQNYKTIPVVYGVKMSKLMLSSLAALTLIPLLLLVTSYNLGKMYFYFYGSMLLLILFLFILWQSRQKWHYLLLHLLLKTIIVAGVISIVLIDPTVFLRRIVNL
ncbi:MAG: geranylgeranylglycerol-phosphate geranylgeranyltransferase [Dokdonia sp.]|jgi:4-hydroxybenzoate polyprenyltransferase